MENLVLYLDKNGNIYTDISSDIYHRQQNKDEFKIINKIDFLDSNLSKQIIKEMEKVNLP